MSNIPSMLFSIPLFIQWDYCYYYWVPSSTT